MLALLLILPARGEDLCLLRVLTVMDFVDHSGEGHRQAWVGEALSEMLTADLVDSEKFAVVDRDKLDAHYREMSLARDGLVSPETASSFGRIAAASHVIFGAYVIRAGNVIQVEANVLDVARPAGTRKIAIEGNLSRLADLKRELSLKILAGLDVKIDAGAVDFTAGAGTVSTEAAEAYYLGRLAIRAKELETALGHMLAAIRADAGYAEPYSALIDIYHALGEEQHARLARAAFYAKFPNHKLLFRELYDEAEELREAGKTTDAIALYERVVKETLNIYAAGAWVRLAELKAAGDDEKIKFYNRALKIRPDIGLFKAEAVKALSKLGGLKGETARRMCYAPVEEIREIAYEAVIKEGDREGMQILRAIYLDDKNFFGNDRGSIGRLFLNQGGMEEWKFLLEATKKGQGAYAIVEGLCCHLAKQKYEGMLDALPSIIASLDAKGKAAFIHGIAYWNHPGIKSAIRGALREAARDGKDFQTIVAACQTLGGLGDKESIPLLKGLLNHDYYQIQTRTYEVRKAAYDALLAMGEQVEKPVLTGEGYLPATRSGTTALQSIMRRNFPTIGTLATQQNGEGISWSSGKGYGYRDPLLTLVRMVREGGYAGFIHYNPWVSRGTERLQEEMGKQDARVFPILSAAAVEDLQMADSIVAVSAFNIEDDVMTALRDYIRGGGGLVVFCAFNMVNPNKTDTFYELMGLPPGANAPYWFSFRQGTHFTAVADHPLVKGMPGGVPMPYGRNFYSSLYYEKELFSKDKHTVVMRTDNPDCEAVVVREYGKGRIVILNWNIFLGFASRVGHLTGAEFLMRCMDWAGKMDEKYAAPWDKAGDSKLSAAQKNWRAAYHARWDRKWAEDPLQGLWRIDVGTEPPAATNRTRPEIFAAMPFNNLTGDPALAPMAQSMPAVLGALFERASGWAQVERQDIEAIVAEQKLGLSGIVDPRSAAGVGAVLGAKYLVFSSLRRERDELVLVCRIHNVETTVIMATVEARGRAADIVALLQSAATGLAEKGGIRKMAGNLPIDKTPLANLHYLQGLAHMHRGDPARAAGEFTIARRYAPNHKLAREWLARAYLALGHSEHAGLERP